MGTLRCCRFLSASVIFASVLTSLVLSANRASAQASREGPSFSASSTGLHRYPDAAYDSDHAVYVAITGANPIRGRFMTADGVLFGTASFPIHETLKYTQTPRVAFGSGLDGGNGGFLVTWLDSRLNSDSAAVFGRLLGFNVGGTPKFLTGDFQISTATGAFSESGPAVAYASGLNRFLVAWRTSPNADIRVRLVGGDGTLMAAEVNITNDTLGQTQPSVAYNPSAQEFLVAYAGWSSTSAFIKSQRIDALTGNAIGLPTTIDTGSSTYVPHVIYDGSQYFVAWYRSGPFYGRFLSGTGGLTGNIFTLNTKGFYDALGLARNPVSDTYFLVTHDGATVEDVGFQISSAGAVEPKFQVTAAAGTGNFNPRITATAHDAQWLVVTANSFNKLVAQRVKTAGFVGGPPPPPPPPPPSCTYTVSPTSLPNVPAAGGPYTFIIVANTGCTWTASSDQAWATITSGASGSGNGNTTVSIAANAASSSRSATLTIAGRSIPATQAGAGTPPPSGAPPLPADQWATPLNMTVGDYDGDGRSDATVYRVPTAQWFINSLSGQQTIAWGATNISLGDVPVPADYDGDGKTDAAVFRRSTCEWFIRRSSDGGTISKTWGFTSSFDVPVPADYDGDGKADIAVYRRANGFWSIFRSASQSSQLVSLGSGGQPDVPVPGDWDGDGDDDVAIYRISTGEFKRLGNVNVDFGTPNVDLPVPADYDGDGKLDVAVYDTTNALWRVRYSSGGTLTVAWGAPSLGDLPVPGKFDGDGKADIAVFRQKTGGWFIRKSTGGWQSYTWGNPSLGDIVRAQ